MGRAGGQVGGGGCVGINMVKSQLSMRRTVQRPLLPVAAPAGTTRRGLVLKLCTGFGIATKVCLGHGRDLRRDDLKGVVDPAASEGSRPHGGGRCQKLICFRGSIKAVHIASKHSAVCLACRARGHAVGKAHVRPRLGTKA